MEYMFRDGFLGTRAPFFMDFTTLIVALLPFLIAISIYFARKKSFKVHQISQIVILIFSTTIITYFEYGVRVGGGFKGYIEESSFSSNIAILILIIHIIIALYTLYIWVATIIKAKKSKNHIQDGKKVVLGIVATSISGIWIYIILFIL
ncbi:hypothetical protein MNB_SV-15-423 [hydrothermal vent metagenome]|uniref:DUF420 domain-containing protein n=1 Tax=hydrothermal vent metagenome TaxID=652676 RepID=A0A1W1EIU0_9ZZZZ